MTEKTWEELHDELAEQLAHARSDLKLAEQHNREQGREIDRLKTELAIAKMDLARLRKFSDENTPEPFKPKFMDGTGYGPND